MAKVIIEITLESEGEISDDFLSDFMENMGLGMAFGEDEGITASMSVSKEE